MLKMNNAAIRCGYNRAIEWNDYDYRSAIVNDIPRMLELELPPFAEDAMDFEVSRAKSNMLDEYFAHLDEYDAADHVREK